MSFWIILILMLTFMTDTDSFLFPDLSHRSGMEAPSYKIAVLQEEPYLYSNGSGYVTDLLEEMARSEIYLKADLDTPPEIIAVKTWKQLITASKASKYQLGFGLQLPSVDHKTVKRSTPVVSTSPKLVVKTRAAKQLTGLHSSKGNTSYDTSALLNIAAANVKLIAMLTSPAIVMMHSPLAMLLEDSLSYAGEIYQVMSSDQQIDLVSLTNPADSVILTSAEVADHMANKRAGFLTSTCSSSSIPGTESMFYGFFGKDSRLLKWVNRILLDLLTRGRMQQLNHRYFSSVKYC